MPRAASRIYNRSLKEAASISPDGFHAKEELCRIAMGSYLRVRNPNAEADNAAAQAKAEEDARSKGALLTSVRPKCPDLTYYSSRTGSWFHAAGLDVVSWELPLCVAAA